MSSSRVPGNMDPVLLVLVTFAATVVLVLFVVSRIQPRRESPAQAPPKSTDQATILELRAKVAELEAKQGKPAYPENERSEAQIADLKQEARERGRRAIRLIEGAAEDEADYRARSIVLDAMQRNAVQYVAEATTELVPIASEDVKGRLIGREGRNIRAFEQTTGVDLIIDDTPGAVTLSTFDPLRREIARQTLLELLKDGRIQPARIEELFAKAQSEVEREISKSGADAAVRAGVQGLPPQVLKNLGRLRYRTSYAQNVLEHSVECAHLAAVIAHELHLNAEVARRAALLHDIGKGLDSAWEGPHAISGAEFLKQAGEPDVVTHAVAAHHYEVEPKTPEAIVVIVADKISAARPGARRENLEGYITRVAALEALAMSFRGVEQAFAVQAGRELRLFVRPDEIDDIQAAQLAQDIARRIEAELESSGQVKVTVIRETRVHEVAKPN